MQINQLLGHCGPPLQLLLRPGQTLNLPVPGISGLAVRGFACQTVLAVRGQLPAPGGQLAGVQTVSTQPGAFLPRGTCSASASSRNFSGPLNRLRVHFSRRSSGWTSFGSVINLSPKAP